VLTETLALAHPIIPFVTEEIYSFVPGADGLLGARVEPPVDAAVDEPAEAELARLIEAVQAVRAWRDSAGVKAGAVVATRLAATNYEQTSDHLARLARLRFSQDGGEPVASVPVPGGAIEILASDALDLEAAERKRAAAREKLEDEITRSERMLANEGFVSKAKPEVVQAERGKLQRLRAELEAL
jgi:valyl-tRNA synthetase